MKQRIPVNSIISKLVLKSMYMHPVQLVPSLMITIVIDLNRLNSSFAKKTDFLSRYLVLSGMRHAPVILK